MFSSSFATLHSAGGHAAADTLKLTMRLRPRGPLVPSGGGGGAAVLSGGASAPSLNPFAFASQRRSSANLTASPTTPDAESAKPSSDATSHQTTSTDDNSAQKAAHLARIQRGSQWAAAVRAIDIVLSPTRRGDIAALLAEHERHRSTAASSAQALCTNDILEQSPLFMERYYYGREEVCQAVRCLGDDGATEALLSHLTAALTACMERHVKGLADRSAPIGNGPTATAADDNDDDNCQTGPGPEDNIGLMTAVVAVWEAVQSAVAELSAVFMYLDRRYVLTETADGSIRSLSVRLLKQQLLFGGTDTLSRAVVGFTESINRERDGDSRAVPVQTLVRFRDLVSVLGMYHSALEPQVTASASKRFLEDGYRLVDGGDDEISAADFFSQAEALMRAEHARTGRYLDPRTRPHIDRLLQTQLLKPHIAGLFARDLPALVAGGRLDDITRGFRLMCLRHVGEKPKAKAAFRSLLTTIGKKAVLPQVPTFEAKAAGGGADAKKSAASASAAAADTASMIPDLLELRRAAGVLINTCFAPAGHAEEFSSVTRDAFEEVMALRKGLLEDLLSRYMDGVLRCGSLAVPHTPEAKPVIGTLHPAASAAAASFPGGSVVPPSAPRTPTSADPMAVMYSPVTPHASAPFPRGGGAGGAVLSDGGAFAAAASTAAVEDGLAAALQLYTYVNAKDLFEAHYMRAFARRVIHRRSASIDLERVVIRRMRLSCGNNLTSKLDGMLKDLDGSAEMTRQFQAAVSGSSSSPAATFADRTTVEVLTEGSWPFYDSFTPATYPSGLDGRSAPVDFFPPVCRDTLASFESFYKGKFNGRKLSWVHSLSQCTIHAAYPARSGASASQGPLIHKEFVVSLMQGLILSQCFNECETMSFADILRRVCKVDETSGQIVVSAVGIRNNATGTLLAGLDKDEHGAAMAATGLTQQQMAVRTQLVCALLSLSAPNMPILLRSKPTGAASTSTSPSSPAGGKDMPDTDLFTFNPNFTHNLRVIRVPQVQLRSDDRVNGGADDDADAEMLAKKTAAQRALVMDAMIVRHIKARQTMTFAQLLDDTARALAHRFVVEAAVVKARIEQLITRGIIARDTQDPSTFHFKS